MSRQISEGRQIAYYVGGGLAVVGGLMFASTFLIAAANFGNFSNFEGRAQSAMFLAIGGMALILVGAIISNIGAKGLAGSGIVLDPQQAKEDLEPYARMAGGLVKDVLNEANVHLGETGPERIVVLKCPTCGTLNQEDARFCKECGKRF